MHPHHYTISILKHILDKTEHTLFPPERLLEMHKEYKRLAADPATTLDTVEKTIITFGKELWPYHEGLEELYRRHGKKKEEARVRETLNPELREKYDRYIAAGGSLGDFRRGSDTEVYFTPEEKYELGHAVVEAHAETMREIAGSCRADKQHECEEVIEDHRNKLTRIEKKLLVLRDLARSSDTWRAEIEDKINVFEHAFGYLERTFHESDLDGTIDYYQGIIN